MEPNTTEGAIAELKKIDVAAMLREQDAEFARVMAAKSANAVLIQKPDVTVNGTLGEALDQRGKLVSLGRAEMVSLLALLITSCNGSTIDAACPCIDSDVFRIATETKPNARKVAELAFIMMRKSKGSFDGTTATFRAFCNRFCDATTITPTAKPLIENLSELAESYGFDCEVKTEEYEAKHANSASTIEKKVIGLKLTLRK